MSNGEWTKVESEAWIPKEANESIEGIYLGKQTEVGENKSNLYTMELAGGNQVNFWGCKVLDGKMIGIESGQPIKVVYLGKKKSEGSIREYKDYDVFKKAV